MEGMLRAEGAGWADGGSVGKVSPTAEMDRDSAPAGQSFVISVVDVWPLTSGTSRASAGIRGRESLRGPPHAEQDMEAGVFRSVHRGQSHARAWRSAAPPSDLRLSWLCCPPPGGRWDCSFSGLEQLMERRGLGLFTGSQNNVR